jgi:hypothetical protein
MRGQGVTDMMYALRKREQAESEFFEGGGRRTRPTGPPVLSLSCHIQLLLLRHTPISRHIPPAVLNGDRISVGANLRSLPTPSLPSFPTIHQHIPPFFLSQQCWRLSDAALHPPWPRRRPTGEGQGFPRRSEGHVRYSEGRPGSLQGLASGKGTRG